MSVAELQSLSDTYERAEADFLTSVGTEADRGTLAAAARRTATAAAENCLTLLRRPRTVNDFAVRTQVIDRSERDLMQGCCLPHECLHLRHEVQPPRMLICHAE